jgi:hypothetical protein
MNLKPQGAIFRSLLAILCIVALVPGDTLTYTSSAWQSTASSPQSQAAKIPEVRIKLDACSQRMGPLLP